MSLSIYIKHTIRVMAFIVLVLGVHQVSAQTIPPSSGSGWYFATSTAPASAAPAISPISGFTISSATIVSPTSTAVWYFATAPLSSSFISTTGIYQVWLAPGISPDLTFAMIDGARITPAMPFDGGQYLGSTYLTRQ